MTNNYMCSVMATCWGLTSIVLNLFGQRLSSYIAIVLGISFVFFFEKVKDDKRI